MTETAIEDRQQWLDACGEGSLDAAAASRLDAALAADPRLAAEKAQWQALHRALRDDRVAVRPGFTEKVMAALPAPAWGPAGAGRAFAPALVAALLLCTLGATFLLSDLADQPLAGTGLALADFLQTTLLAGSGIVAATWVGLGFGLEELFAASGTSLVAFGLMVLFLDLLFLSLLRRRGPAPAAAKSGG